MRALGVACPESLSEQIPNLMNRQRENLGGMTMAGSRFKRDCWCADFRAVIKHDV